MRPREPRAKGLKGGVHDPAGLGEERWQEGQGGDGPVSCRCDGWRSREKRWVCILKAEPHASLTGSQVV